MTTRARTLVPEGDLRRRVARRALTPALASAEAAIPIPDPPARRRLIRATAALALLVSAAYLTWRLAVTLGTWWVAVPLWLLEAHAAIGLGLFTFSLWDVDATSVPTPVATTDLRVAVVIATYNEPREVLLPTVAAATALSPAHETWVLDDGGRAWVRELAASLGARYLARAEHHHAKAGNLNHALEYIDADLVAILDADHVVTANFLTHTLGYFADPSIAIVQTPQDFYNVDSFEHGPNHSWLWRSRRDVAFNEQRLFYRALQPGKNRWGAAFWCGTNALVRVAALREIGGVATETVTEDIHTTIRLHRRGWRTIYHNEVLAHGLAAGDATQYQAQRLRWGTGAMQLLHLEHPLTRRGLTVTQRLAYASTILGWFDAWRTLGYVLIPLVVLVSGVSPIHASAPTFLLAFGVTFGLQRLALGLLSRGYAPSGLATLFEFVRLQSTIAATLSYLRPGERAFTVTVKEGADVRHRNEAPWLLWLLVAASGAVGVWFALSLAGVTPVSYPVRWTAYGAAFWALVNVAFLVAAIARIRSDRYATDRRTGVRQRLDGEVGVDGARAHLIDLSVGGALVRVEGGLAADPVHVMELTVAEDEVVELVCEERSHQRVGAEGDVVSVRFAPGQDVAVGRLAVALFGARA